MSAVYLVSCVAQKAGRPMPAKELYVSDWFRKARAYVESTGAPWFILSALYQVLSPSTVIPPYDYTLIQNDNLDRIRRQTWSRITADLLARRLFKGTRLVIFAGAKYREFLIPELGKRGFECEVPLAGLGIGQQKRWFVERLGELNQSSLPCFVQDKNSEGRLSQ